MSLYEVSCNDVAKLVDQQGLTETVKAQCGEKDFSSNICGILPLLGPGMLASKLGVSKEVLGKVLTKVQPYCEELLTKCKPSFCDKEPKDIQLTLTCTDLKKAMDGILNDPDAQELIRSQAPIHVTAENKCKLLGQVAQGDVDKVVLLITNIIKPFLPNPDQGTLKAMVECTCPDLSQYLPPPVDKVKTDIYNRPAILATLIVLVIIGLIVVVIYIIVSKAAFPVKLAFFALVVCLITAVMLGLVYANPGCRYQFCPIAGEDWKPAEGKFKGEKSMLDQVTVKAELELFKNNTVRLDLLTCDGSGCPLQDLLSKCPDDKKILINTSEKTANGYALYGDCLDRIKEIKGSDGKSTIQGAWVVRQGDQFSLQLFVHVIFVGVDMSQLIKVPLTRV